MGELEIGDPEDKYSYYRNWFTFDLTRLSGRVIDARLEVTCWQGIGPDDKEDLGLFDVSTDAAPLNGRPIRSARIYEDLGSGTSYGMYRISTNLDWETVVVLPLNGQAVEDINRAAGGFFSIGGALLSIEPGGADEALFGSSGGDGIQRLVVTLAES